MHDSMQQSRVVIISSRGLIKEICARIRVEHGKQMKVISTGGLAPLFQGAEKLFDAFEDELTMHGLRLIHDHNQE